MPCVKWSKYLVEECYSATYVNTESTAVIKCDYNMRYARASTKNTIYL